MVADDFSDMIKSRGLDFVFETDPPFFDSDVIEDA
jgi:hypothetical protein